MPLAEDADCGANADGNFNFDYCKYCFDYGAFSGIFTMVEMAEHCSQFVDENSTNIRVKI